MNELLAEWAAAAERARSKMEFDRLPDPSTGPGRIAWAERLINVFHPELREAVPLVCNDMQRDILGNITPREITLKSRRAGLTTIYVADAWIDILTIPGTKVELFAHDQDTADDIFDQVVRYQYERIPDSIRPKATTDNVRELAFKSLDSYFVVKTAGQSETVAMKKGQGRAISTLILTEMAFYAYGEDLYSKIKNCIPVRGGKIRIDSTPNGMETFYQRFRAARAGMGDFKARFYPWWWDPANWLALRPEESIEPTEEEIKSLADNVERYGNPAPGASRTACGLTAEQLKFRRWKIADLLPRGSLTAEDVYIVEYPEDEQSCFLHSGRPLFLAKDLALRCKPRPAIEGHWHGIGHDSSTGDASGDPAGVAVIDLDTGEQVYEWRGWEPTDSQAERLVQLQKDYPGILVVERNTPGDSVLMLLRRWGVQNVYKHRDKELREGIGVKAYKRKPGFPMSDSTKPRLFTELRHSLSRGELTLCGQKTIDDLKGFQYDDDDRIAFQGSAEHYREAGEFSHGELGVAIGLAWHARKTGSIGVG